MTLAESIVDSIFVTPKNEANFVQVIHVLEVLNGDPEAVRYRIVVSDDPRRIGTTDWAFASNLLDTRFWERFDPPCGL